MSRETKLKFLQFAIILVVGIASDLGTKRYAEARLATQSAHPKNAFSHVVYVPVPDAMAGKTVKDVLAAEFTWNNPDEIDKIGRFYTYERGGTRQGLASKVRAGQVLEVRRREVTIIEGWWDFQYTRNPGAAFGFLADADSPWRRPFFLGVGVVALLTILYILAGVALGQQIMIWGLSLIAAGAIGNLVNRIQYNYVVDFILWKYTDAHRFPTFNVADAWISIGVGLMIIEIIRESLAERRGSGRADADATTTAQTSADDEDATILAASSSPSTEES